MYQITYQECSQKEARNHKILRLWENYLVNEEHARYVRDETNNEYLFYVDVYGKQKIISFNSSEFFELVSMMFMYESDIIEISRIKNVLPSIKLIAKGVTIDRGYSIDAKIHPRVIELINNGKHTLHYDLGRDDYRGISISEHGYYEEQMPCAYIRHPSYDRYIKE